MLHSEWRAMMDAALLPYQPVEEEDTEPPFSISIPGHEVTLSDLKGGPAKILKWLSANEPWTVKACVSETRHQPVVYAADSKTTGARKGDMKTPERVKLHTSVQGVLVVDRKKIADLMVTWVTIEEKTLFVDAIIWDAYTEQRLAEKATTPFEDWLRMFAPIGASKPRAVKMKQADKSLDVILNEGEWIG